MQSKSSKVIAYVASPHAGYLKFFREYEGSVLYVLGDELIRKFPSLVRHLPGVAPEESQKMIQALGIFSDVRILTPSELYNLRYSRIVMPDEDVSHALAKDYFTDALVEFDGRWRLRWDWGATQKNRRPEGERVVSVDELDRELMRSAFREADRSPDWWRQIGALLVKDGIILLAAFNQHVPHEQSVYCYGDPRSNFEPGQCIEVSSAAHAEMVLLRTAAARGICTAGCDLCVTTFPCPPCAGPWSFAGLRRLYYTDG
ncbi:MAG: deaminase, partial [Candidatus Paceibacterota bacterium]